MATRRLIPLFVTAVVCFWALAIVVHSARLLGPNNAFQDYVVFYSAGSLVADGRGSEIYDLDAMREAERRAFDLDREVPGMPFLNPPYMAPLYAPLSLLPLPLAGLVVAVVTAATIFAAGLALRVFLGLASGREGFVLVAGFLSFRPVVQALLEGQLTMLLLLGVLGFVLLQAAGRQRASGLSLAALLIKPNLAVLPLAYLAWRRQWRALGAFLGAGAVLAALAVAVCGPGVVLDYPRSLAEVAGWDGIGGVHRERMSGWSAFFSALAPFGSAAHSGLTYSACIATAAVVFLTWRRPADVRGPSFLDQTAIILVAGLLISPHLNTHDIVLAGLAIALAARAEQMRSGTYGIWPAAALAAWLVMLLAPELAVQAHFSLGTPVMAALFALLLRTNLREARVAIRETQLAA